MVREVPSDLPPRIQETVGTRNIPVFPCPAVASTDESVRRRRRHFGEHVFPVSVLIEHEGRFVLARYAKDPPPRGWTVPGGYAEPGEALEAAAIREAREECGLTIDRLVPVGIVTTEVTSATEGVLGYHLTVFGARSSGGNLTPEDSEEIDEVRLATSEEIDALAAAGQFPSIHPTLDAAIVECLRLAARLISN